MRNRRQFLKSGLGVVAARSVVDTRAVASSQVLPNEKCSKTTEKSLLFMDDADVLQFCPYPMTREHLANYISFLAGSGADILSWNVNLSGVCWYGTKVGAGIFEGPKEFPHYAVRHMAANIRHLVAIGADPPGVVAEECHRHGMRMVARFAPSLARYDEDEFRQGGGIYYNHFSQSHPEFTIQRVDPATAGFGVKPGQHLDFTHPEVREWLLRPMREMAEQYDVDGLDLFFRGGAYFEADEAVNKAPIMTDFIATIRKLLDEAARKRGHPHLLLTVAVPDRLNWAMQLGLDVSAWIKNGLVDIVMPSRVHGLDFEAPVGEYVASCKGTHCQVLPTLQPGIPPHKFPYTRPQLRAAVDNWYRRGADGFSTFNFNHRYHRHLGGDTCVSLAEALAWLHELRDPSRVAAEMRVYPFYRIREMTRLENLGLTFAPSEVGSRKTLPIPSVGALRAPGGRRTLRLVAAEYSWDDVLEADIDGKPLGKGSPRFEVDPDVLGAITGTAVKPEEGESVEWPYYVMEFEIPGCDSYRELGIRLVKCSNVLSNIQIHSIEIVIAGGSE